MEFLLSVALFLLITNCCYAKRTSGFLEENSTPKFQGLLERLDARVISCDDFDVALCTEDCVLGFETNLMGCIVSCRCKVSGLFDGDIVMTAEEARKYFAANTRGAPSRKLKRWNMRGPGGTYIIPYSLHSSVTMRNFASKTCVRLETRTNEVDYIEFVDGNECASSYGRVGGKQNIYIGTGCDKEQGIIIHEIMHALGFFHEHSRPDRDRFVKIHLENVISGERYNFAKLTKRVINSMGSPYDYQSVMHYSGYSFSSNGQATIIDRRSNKPAVAQRKGFSLEDIKQINLMYKCKRFRSAWYSAQSNVPSRLFVSK